MPRKPAISDINRLVGPMYEKFYRQSGGTVKEFINANQPKLQDILQSAKGVIHSIGLSQQPKVTGVEILRSAPFKDLEKSNERLFSAIKSQVISPALGGLERGVSPEVAEKEIAKRFSDLNRGLQIFDETQGKTNKTARESGDYLSNFADSLSNANRGFESFAKLSVPGMIKASGNFISSMGNSIKGSVVSKLTGAGIGQQAAENIVKERGVGGIASSILSGKGILGTAGEAVGSGGLLSAAGLGLGGALASGGLSVAGAGLGWVASQIAERSSPGAVMSDMQKLAVFNRAGFGTMGKMTAFNSEMGSAYAVTPEQSAKIGTSIIGAGLEKQFNPLLNEFGKFNETFLQYGADISDIFPQLIDSTRMVTDQPKMFAEALKPIAEIRSGVLQTQAAQALNALAPQLQAVAFGTGQLTRGATVGGGQEIKDLFARGFDKQAAVSIISQTRSNMAANALNPSAAFLVGSLAGMSPTQAMGAMAGMQPELTARMAGGGKPLDRMIKSMAGLFGGGEKGQEEAAALMVQKFPMLAAAVKMDFPKTRKMIDAMQTADNANSGISGAINKQLGALKGSAKESSEALGNLTKSAAIFSEYVHLAGASIFAAYGHDISRVPSLSKVADKVVSSVLEQGYMGQDATASIVNKMLKVRGKK